VVPSVKCAKEQVEDILQEMRKLKRLQETIPKTRTDNLLNGLSYKDFPALRHARAQLNIKSQNKKIDVFFCARITAMAGTLNLYLDLMLFYLWHKCSLLATKTAGHGIIMQGIFGYGFDNTSPPKSSLSIIMGSSTLLSWRIKISLKTSSST
jgi:hypothetical protein